LPRGSFIPPTFHAPLLANILIALSALVTTMASSPSKDHDIELHEIGSRSTDRRDDIALARLGKKAVLKVSANILIVPT
jgi:hypothetical protein